MEISLTRPMRITRVWPISQAETKDSLSAQLSLGHRKDNNTVDSADAESTLSRRRITGREGWLAPASFRMERKSVDAKGAGASHPSLPV